MGQLVTLHMTDIGGNQKTMVTFLPSASTLTQIQGFVTGFAPLIDAINGAVINRATVELGLTLPGGLKSTADSGSTVHRGGLFGYDNASPYKWGQYVPALTPTLFTGDLVNVGDTDIAAYITAMEDGITVSGTPIQPQNQYDDDLTTNITATQSFRK